MRLQILHLPGAADDWPFALVVDRFGDDVAPDIDALRLFANDIGARAVLASAADVEVE